MRTVDQQLASPLGRAVGKSPLDDEQLRDMAKRANQATGGRCVLLDLSKIDDHWTKQAVLNEAAKQGVKA